MNWLVNTIYRALHWCRSDMGLNPSIFSFSGFFFFSFFFATAEVAVITAMNN